MNDLEQLREDVRSTAPQPRPEFAARLERRVAAGFTTAKPPRQPRQWSLRSLAGPAIALALTALLVVPIALVDRGGDEEGGSGGGAESSQSAEEPALKSEFGDEASGGGASGRQSAPYAAELDALGPATRSARGRGGDRVVEQRTALELETGADAFTETTDGVLQVADDTGSIVQRSRVTERDGKGFARFDLRVPATRLDETLADLSRLGHVTSRSASSQDITRAYVSASARLDDARDERRALLEALERADTDAEAESLRRQIALARARIALAERDVTALQRRADRAKVSVTVRSTGRKTEGGAWTPGDAVDDAGRILEVAVGVVVVAAAVLAPVALLALLAGLAARTLRRRRREAALDTP